VASSFRAQLLQQMMGELDHASMAVNEADGSTRTRPITLDQLLGSRPGPDHGPVGRKVMHRSTPSAADGHLPQSVRHPVGLYQVKPRLVPSPSHAVPPKPALVSLPEFESPAVAPIPPRVVPSQASAADGFLSKLAGIAQVTAEALGLSPHLLLAQAALETGWGRKAIKNGAGQESHNLFGIKADRHWTGATVEVQTTEYIHGLPQKKMESFRAYGSYADSFADYAKLIKHRYGAAIANGATAEGFGQALQAKGYATDPNYAQKIARVAQSVAYRLASKSIGNS